MDFSNIVLTYGLEASCIALVTIILIGIVKLIFKKGLKDAGSAACKSIYESLSIILAYGLSAAWLALAVNVFHIKTIELSWQVFLEQGSIAYVVVKVMYPLYENYHIRDLLKLLGNAIFKHKTTSKAVSTAAEPVNKLPEPVREVSQPTAVVNETLPIAHRRNGPVKKAHDTRVVSHSNALGAVEVKED